MNRFLRVTLDGSVVSLASPPLYFSKEAPGNPLARRMGVLQTRPGDVFYLTNKARGTKKESRYPLNRRLGGSQTLSGCCGNTFFASVENLLSISRSSTLPPISTSLANQHSLLWTYDNGICKYRSTPDGRNLKKSEAITWRRKPQLWSATSWQCTDLAEQLIAKLPNEHSDTIARVKPGNTNHQATPHPTGS